MFKATKTKNDFVRLRVTDEEKETLLRAATEKGMDMSNFLRYCISNELNKKSEEVE